jgi:hypothetical protein
MIWNLKEVVRAVTPPIFISTAIGIHRLFFKLRPSREPADLTGKFLYYGNLSPEELQFSESRFVGLALHVLHERDVSHSAYDRLPCQEQSIEKIQAEDVFEHLEFNSVPKILDDIYRVLIKGGTFRLSVPDYLSQHNLEDSFFDSKGKILGDTASGATITYDRSIPGKRVIFTKDGGAHLWFPTYDLVNELISKSEIRKCSEIVFYQYNKPGGENVNNPFPINSMPVKRVPPLDMRNGGNPVSIVVDFIK